MGEADEWLRLLMDNLEDYTGFLLDGEARVVSWNAGVQRLLGYSRGQFLGLPFEHFFGRRYWGVLLALWDRHHQLRGYTYLMRNRAADQRTGAERLELLRRLDIAQADAKRANQTRDTFLAAVSHELRTPLNAILGWAHLLSAGHLSHDKAVHAIETIERNAKAQAQLIDDLLDASRLMTGTLELDVHPLTLSSVVRAAIERVQPEADAKQVHLSLASADDRDRIEGDAVRLRQAVVKLLANAITFTPANGMITVNAEEHEGAAELRVRDTSEGLSAKVLSPALDPSHQGGEPERMGPGLGLGIARQIIEAHGGTIAAAREGAGPGTIVTVRLPFVPGRPTAAAVHATAPANETCSAALVGRCALVVEDHADSQEFLDAVMTHCGMRVIAVDSVHDALEALDAQPVDVIISDIGLATEDGLALMRRVRELSPERGGRVPAIAVSAHGGPADRTRATEAGYQRYIAKPLNPAELITAVTALLGLA